MFIRTDGSSCVDCSVPRPTLLIAVLLFKNKSGIASELPSMKKIRMHMTTSTIGVMFGPTCTAVFFITPLRLLLMVHRSRVEKLTLLMFAWAHDTSTGEIQSYAKS